MPPITLDVFNQDAFSATSLTAAVNKEEYLPGLLGGLGLFEDAPVNTTAVWLEERGDALALVPNSPRGGDPELANQAGRKRVARPFSTLHLVKADAVYADEVQSVRAFGSETELQVVQAIVNERLAQLRRDLALTLEHLMLGCVKGALLDADGSTELLNLFTAFGVSQETEVDFDLDNASPASGALRKVCTGVVRKIHRNCKGLEPREIIALCGDAFWDDLTAHPEVRATYLNYTAAQDLRGGLAWDEFRYGGLRFVNYRGTDDGTTVGVNTDKCHVFPVGVPGLFKMHFAPADRFEFSNTRGLPYYAFQDPDPKDRYRALEVQSNPLPLCTQPKVLIQGKRT